MKMLTKVCIGIALIFYAAVAMAGQTQQNAPGEVPEGITAEDWGIVQEAYLKASNTDGGDYFGNTVAISGDTIVIGTKYEKSSATGINGNQSDNSAAESGAAYVFVRNGHAWSQQAYLKASNTDAFDHFGYSVSISGDTIVVGARGERSSATGVDGNQTDNSAGFSGAAYVFVRDETTWSQQAYLKASNASGGGDEFGRSVAISGDTIVVGAIGERSSATGVDGNQTDISAIYAGAAYVFVRDGTMWTQQAYLKASNTERDDYFGERVSISGNTVVVQATGEDSSATGVNGNQANNSASDSGAIYVFVRNESTWSQQAYLKGWRNDHHKLTHQISISGDTLVTGGHLYAYVHKRNGTTWSEQALLTPPHPEKSDRFGRRVSISGEALVVGAYLDNSAATGVNGDETNTNAPYAGAAYLYARNGSTWSQQAYLKASNTGEGDYFGWSLAVSGNSVVVCADGEDSSSTGVNGNQADNSAVNAGAAYIFTGFGVPGSATITGCSPVPEGIRIEWVPVSGNNSIVKCSTDLVNEPFTNLSAALPYPVNSYTDTVHGTEGQCFYRVDLEP